MGVLVVTVMLDERVHPALLLREVDDDELLELVETEAEVELPPTVEMVDYELHIVVWTLVEVDDEPLVILMQIVDDCDVVDDEIEQQMLADIKLVRMRLDADDEVELVILDDMPVENEDEGL